MCIRDRLKRVNWDINWLSPDGVDEKYNRVFFLHENSFYWEQYGIKDFSFLRPASEGEGCLLYTSDAADERSSVDLGGRRIIKKKKIITRRRQQYNEEKNIVEDTNL